MSTLTPPFSLQKGERRLIGGQYFVPYLVLDNSNQIFWFASEFLRYIGERGVDEKSIYNDATRLCKFFTWVYAQGGTYETVDDKTLKEYKLLLKGYESTTLSSYFRTIIQCYAVGQELDFLDNHIGHSSYVEHRHVKIHVTCRSKNKPNYNNVTWIYAPKVTTKAPTIPLTRDINRLLDEILSTNTSNEFTYELRQRDYLIVRWMRDAFLREAEVVGLCVKNIPTRENSVEYQLYEHLDSMESDELPDNGSLVDRIPITLTRGCKYGKKRTVHVPASLVWETQDFIENDRVEIISQTGCRKSQALFPSLRDGEQLTPNYIPHLLKHYCSNLGVVIKPHSLRKYGITRLIYLRIIDAENKKGGAHSRESVIYEVSQMAGHSDVKTTEKYYIDLKRMGGYFDRDTLKRDLASTNIYQTLELERARVKKLQSEVTSLKKQLRRKKLIR